MKKLLVLLFSLLLSFNSHAEWFRVGESTAGYVAYYEIDTVKEHGGYVYYWVMLDYLIPTEDGDMSASRYLQGECEVGRVKTLSMIFYKQPMGKGESETYNPPPEWDYPAPGSLLGVTTNYVCNYLNQDG
ncbi:surface-adhesin E family protein [Candidatus Pseudothioglobus singularis]|jgi:hypothetical protein|uniref:Surface-adhesin protein E-like domain-containing protein n=1 Tax=Candidatus Pseudothioglobus singularis PS1 TaxID=1125411 RepID=A0A0M4M4A9_9GAMM|nr:surface-adhesin E family protein [Candidatus Pseudothioglobus singularis]ALE02667.1 hypothetical protein W908_03430 [Candidatus Pseudothioglobus singularis PS1]